MATKYIPAYKGYITDVPELWFKRNDGQIFHFDQLTAASMAPQVNFTEVNAGWSLYPVAYLPGQSTMEMQATSGQFNADLFAMANGKTFASKAVKIPYTGIYTVTASSHTIEFVAPGNVEKTDVVIKNMALDADESLTPPNEFKVEVAPASEVSEAAKKVTVTFADATLDNKEVEVSYETTVENINVIDIDNTSTAVGQLIAKWPVYANGDEEAANSAAGIKGYVMMKIYKCRVTAMPGFDTSYKSSATNSVTFSALDPKLNNGITYSLAYYDTAAVDTAAKDK